MSQMSSLYRDLSVAENIRLYAGVYGLGRRETRERTQWVIEMAGLAGYESKPAVSLPMGVAQRLALGCALVHRPQVVFLDEPTSGVDPMGRRRFWDILFKLSHEEGITIMLTTHYMSESEHCAVTILYIFTTTGIGLFVATIARNLAQAGLLTVMIFAPMVFLSGAWTPPEALVGWLRLLMKFSPLHYFLDVGLGIFLKNAGLDILWNSILGIAVLGSGVFAFGLWRFRRQFD